MIGRLEKTVIDCPDPPSLAQFYCQVLGMRVNEDIDGWVVIGAGPGLRQLAFQRVTTWVPPRWPDPAYPQQLHLDIRVSDADRAEQELLALGATCVPAEGATGSGSSPTPPATHSASFSVTPAQAEPSPAHAALRPRRIGGPCQARKRNGMASTRVLPDPDAVVVAPATVNTINKWAAGICDTLALGILVEAIGKKLTTVALPFTNYAQAARPAFEENIGKLRSWGIQVLYGPDVYRLHAPGTGGQHLNAFPWHLALETVATLRPLPDEHT